MNSTSAQKSGSGLCRRIYNFWLGPMDPIGLDTFRMLMGLAMLYYYSNWWHNNAREWLTTDGFHMSAQAMWFSPILAPMPPGFLPFFGIIFFGGLILWTAGLATRWTVWIVWAGNVYFNFVDIFSAYTLNKFFIVTMCVFVFVPHGTYWTPARRNPRPQSAWPLRILQTTLILHYFDCGYTKIFWGDWIRDPNVLWEQLQGIYMTDTAAWILKNCPLGLISWMQYSALSFECLAPVLFMFKRFRTVGMLWGLTFQLLVALTMHQLIYFSLQIVFFYVLFFQDKTLHDLRSWLTNLPGKIEGYLKKFDSPAASS